MTADVGLGEAFNLKTCRLAAIDHWMVADLLAYSEFSWLLPSPQFSRELKGA
jgi:hypothetical protein